jgi:hypothetical protein
MPISAVYDIQGINEVTHVAVSWGSISSNVTSLLNHNVQIDPGQEVLYYSAFTNTQHSLCPPDS